ncbi:MAG: electron transport complex subunit E [bacterium]|nr:electron transport complex subunit E [bacterium]
MTKNIERLFNGIIKENPTFVLMLGMCPTLAVTSSASNGLGMGLTTTAVLIMSNFVISAMRNIIPTKVRIPAFIVIVATLVTMVQLLLQAYIPALNDSLGIYIPLIVVNCIILGRAESYASKNGPINSIFDGIGMGLGFTLGLTSIGIFRELIGNGAIFGHTISFIADYKIGIFTAAPGAFFVLAALTALQNKFKAPCATNKPGKSEIACGGNCGSCSGDTCKGNKDLIEAEQIAAQAEKVRLAKEAAAAKAKAKAEAEAKAAAEAEANK